MILLRAVFSCLVLVGCDCGERARPVSAPSEGTPNPSRAFLTAWGGAVCAGDPRAGVQCFGTDVERDAIYVALGGAGACLIRGSGEAICEGEPVGVEDAVELAVGSEHACALRRSGTVACWGSNARGQLGDGTIETRATATEVSSLGDVQRIAAGAAHTCALRRDGSVWCWGGHPRIEDVAASPRTPAELLAAAAEPPPPRTLPARVAGVDGATAIAASEAVSCALDGDRRIVCWPAYIGTSAQPSVVPWPEDGVALAMGTFGACVARERGGVACWGQRDEGDRTRAVMPVAVRGVDDAADVAVGDDRACTRRRDGTVACWDNTGAIVALGSRADSRY